MRKLSAVVASVLVAGLAVGVAQADQTIYAAPVDMYVNGDITISQGEKVTFTNTDSAVHDVTAKVAGANGQPLFRSDKIGTGQSAPVVGAESLKPGTYDYFCSIHTNMTGTITVTGSSSGSPSNPPPSGGGASDTTAASVTVKVLDRKRSAVRKRRSLQLRVTTNEPVSARITAASGKTVVASGRPKLDQAGTRKVSIKLTKAGIAMTKRHRTVKITVSLIATDAAGNTSSATARGKLR